MLKQVSCLTGFLLLFSAISGAQEHKFDETPGSYTFHLEADTLNAFQLDAVGRKNAIAGIEGLNALFRVTPVMNPPRGFEARSVGRGFVNSGSCPKEHCGNSPFTSNLRLQLYYFVEGREGKPVTGDELDVEANVFTNMPGSTITPRHQMNYDGIQDFDGHMMYSEPRQTRTMGGFPVFDDNAIVITKSRKPFWLPVSRESFLKAALRDTQKGIAAVGMPGSDLAQGLSERLAQLQAELDGLSPEARASQAWQMNSENPNLSGLVPADTAEGRPVVIVNPDFLDRSLPRTAMQIVVVRLNWGTYLDRNDDRRAIDTINDDDRVGVRRLWQLLNQTEWAKLSEMVVAARGASVPEK